MDHEENAFGEELSRWRKSRVPSDEAEWEYACRAGTDTDYYTGDGGAALAEVGGWNKAVHRGTRSVRLDVKNAWGLHDLYGHVWQWCHDSWEDDGAAPRPVFRRQVDGDGDPGAVERWADYATPARWEALLENGRRRVLRGGSWVSSPWGCRSAYRGRGGAGNRDWGRGFRLCLASGPATASTSVSEPVEPMEKVRIRPVAGGDMARGVDAGNASVENNRHPGSGRENHDRTDLAAVRLPRRPKNFP